ncbi:MAG: GTPase Era [Candidatus Omnitrophica bacterium]|nr:GTPase Era [Candidatus Omnitrophota bacterium]
MGKIKKGLKSGMVAIVGRPNVGKSTLLNAILGEKISIVSDVPQTTRRQIRGIYTEERGQIVFIDTPGLHQGQDKLDKYMNRASVGSIDSVEAVVHLVDASEKTGPEEERVVTILNKCHKPIIVGLNKVDITKGKFVPEYIKLWENIRGRAMTEMTDLTLLPLSALHATNVKKLVDMLFEYMPEGPFLYPADFITDLPERMAMADMIREKLFLLMREEVPHSIAVIIESVLPKRGKVLHIKAVILVERESQKEIVIGRGGAVLKEVGTRARKDLEEMLETKVFLELFVKASGRWREDYSTLEDMGFIFSDVK